MALKTSDPREKYTDLGGDPSQHDYDRVFNEQVGQQGLQVTSNQPDADARDYMSDLNDVENSVGIQKPKKYDDSDVAKRENKPESKPSSDRLDKVKKTAKVLISKKRTKLIGIFSGAAIALLLLLAAFAPFGVFVQLKEVASVWGDKFNHTAYSKRIGKVYKLRYFGTKTCSGAVCKFIPNRIEEKELLKLRERGIKTNVDSKGRITHFSYFDEATKTNLKINSSNFDRFYRSNPRFAKSLQLATASPKSIAWRGLAQVMKLNKLGVDRSTIPKNLDEMRQRLYGMSTRASTDTRSGAGNEEGEQAEEERNRASQYGDEIVEESNDLRNTAATDGVPADKLPNTSALTETGAEKWGNIAGATLKGGVMNALGVADGACTAYRYLRLISFAATLYQARDLIRYSSVFLTAADMVKAQKMDPEKAAFIAGILLKKSTTDDGSKGKNFSESPIVTLPMQGRIASSTAIANFNNGTPKLALTREVIGKASELGGATGCKHIKSWYGQTALVITGVFMGAGEIIGCMFAGTGCAALIGTAGVGIASQIAAASFMSYMKPRLIQILSGTIAPDPENDPRGGFGAGTAMASGLGALGGQLGRSGGLPLLSKNSYDNARKSAYTESRFIAAVQNANEPFLNTTYYTNFALYLTNLLMPAATAAYVLDTAGVVSKLAQIPFSTPSKFLFQQVSAADDVDVYRQDLCVDERYLRMGVATDAFCNPIYALTENVLNIDSEQNTTWLYENGYLDADANPTDKDNFGQYIDICVNGTDPIDDEDNDAGTQICVPKEDKKDLYDRWSVFLLDRNTSESLDAARDDELGVGPDGGDTSSLSGEGGDFRLASFNILHSTSDGASNWESRLQRSASVIKNNSLDVVGLQEVRQNQWARLPSLLDGKYGIYPENYGSAGMAATNSVIWNKDTVEFVSGKAIAGYHVMGSYSDKAVIQVRLKLKQSGQDIYLLNQHEPVGNDGSNASATTGQPLARYKSAKERAEYVQNLASEKVPIFLTGDFNSKYNNEDAQRTYQDNRNNSVYCILTAENLLWDSYDAFKGLRGVCPTKSPDTSLTGLGSLGPVDHIFLSRGVSVTKYDATISPPANGSDSHHTVVADISIPGANQSQDGGVVGKGYIGPDGLSSGNCVDYAKWVLSRHTTKYKAGSYGDGKDFAANLGKAFGYKVDHTPAVHAVVSFPTNMANPTYGHVALVAEVKSDGSIVVEEFNWTTKYHYGTHVVSADKVSKLTYAHTEVDWK